MNPQQKTLASVVGATAALALAGLIAMEESGRTVDAKLGPNGELVTEHVKGRQYLEVYADPIGVLTACDGLIRDAAGKPLRRGQTFSEVQCAAMLERALVTHAEPVMKCVPGLKGRDYQIVASVSLAYNIGPRAFCNSTAARRFNAGDWKGGCDAFLRWNRGGGRVIRGLTLRRQRERAICLKGL